MSEVKRYSVIGFGHRALVEDCHGFYVHASDYAALETECAKLRSLAEDRDQQYDMKVKARAQRDAALAECERLREALQKFSDLGIESGNSKWPELDEALACCEAALSIKPTEG